MKAWINGEFVDLDKANVNIFSHSFGRGSAVFEVFDIVSAEKGPAFFGLHQHIDRLFRSAELVYMDLPLSRDEIINACIHTAKENNVSLGAAKLFAYYSGIEFTVIPQNPQVDIAIFCVDYTTFGIEQEDLSAPVDVGISSYKKYHPDTVPVHAKVTGNYVNPYLAMMEVKKKGYEDVIIIDVFGNVSEGATASLFTVKEGKIKTAKLNNVLNGITRLAVIDVVKDTDMQVEETDIKSEELNDLDEAFYSVSLEHIKPIKSIEGKKLGSVCPGPYTQKVINAMNDLYSGNSEKSKDWLIYINGQ
jgi:branched-chain amino acid aminotransferase